MKEKRPLILVGNDDGYSFNGIHTLIDVAREFGDVVVSAPTEFHSGKGSAITITVPLRATLHVEEPGLKVWLVNGTPADCCKLALDQLLDGRVPDLVLSGINHGANLGVASLNSGTMGVIFEGCVHGIESVAFSYGNYSYDADMSACVPVLRNVIARVLDHGLPRGVCLNVNIPYDKGPLKGYKVTSTCMGRWVHEFERRTDPHGHDYYWMTGDYAPHYPADEDTDLYNFNRGWVTVTPCHVDQTDHEAMPAIERLLQ